MKYIFSLTLSLLALFSVNLAQAQDATSLKDTTDNIVAPLMSNKNTPGVAVAIHYQGQDYIYCYGVANVQTQAPVTANTLFELASITKVFTTSALAVLMEQGKIKLTDPINHYLPALVRTQNLPIDQVNVVNLATHTASFPRDITDFGVAKSDQPGFFQALQTWQPSAPISSHYEYSNVGFGLLGMMLENVSGMNYQRLLAQTVLTPLGMNNTFVTVPASKFPMMAQGYNAQNMPAPFYQPQFLYGGGALRSNATDMLQFLKANLGVANNEPANLQQALNNTQQPYYKVRPGFDMGLGWQRMSKTGILLITKNGMNQGFTTFIGFSPEQKYGVVVLTNQRNSLATKMGNQLLQALRAS